MRLLRLLLSLLRLNAVRLRRWVRLARLRRRVASFWRNVFSLRALLVPSRRDQRVRHRASCPRRGGFGETRLGLGVARARLRGRLRGRRALRLAQLRDELLRAVEGLDALRRGRARALRGRGRGRGRPRNGRRSILVGRALGAAGNAVARRVRGSRLLRGGHRLRLEVHHSRDVAPSAGGGGSRGSSGRVSSLQNPSGIGVPRTPGRISTTRALARAVESRARRVPCARAGTSSDAFDLAAEQRACGRRVEVVRSRQCRARTSARRYNSAVSCVCPEGFRRVISWKRSRQWQLSG
mmetsp:Transcript_237/g.926  ORF Transcript_237/g.926 Transcript_237/m.926 type:complete len:295 (+) Transcript_237:1432-2316(+)